MFQINEMKNTRYKMKGKESMDSAKGVYSYAKNPMAKPKQVAPMAGPGGNAEQAKVNKMLQKAQKQEDYYRGM